MGHMSPYLMGGVRLCGLGLVVRVIGYNPLDGLLRSFDL